MIIRTRAVLTPILAALTLAITISNADASDLSVSNQNIRTVWRALELGNIVLGGVMRCPVTLEGSFSSATIAKVAEALIGRVSRAAVGSCTNGSATIHPESLPWHIRYRTFFGTLPRITGIKLLLSGVFFEIESEGNTCSGRSEELEPVNGIANINEGTGEVTGFTAEESTRIRLTNGRGGILCALSRGYFRGTGAVTQLGNTNTIAIRLIGEGGEEVERLTPSPITFGTVEPSELAVRTVTLTAGTGGSTVNSIRVTNGNYFAITDPNRCIRTRLEARGTCAFKVVFVAPSERSRSVEDTVTVETSRETLTDRVSGST